MLRSLSRTPGLAIAAILTFALGVGANAAIFSILYAVLLRPLHYQDPNRLVVLEHFKGTPVAPATYLDWRAQSTAFTDIAAAQLWNVTLRTAVRPEALSGIQVTANMFDLLGVRPHLGRTFAPDDRNVVVLSWTLWQRNFGGRPDALGQQVVINGIQYNVIGVMPESFHFAPYWATNAEIWTPLIFGPRVADRAGRSLRIFGRLRPGIDLRQAQAEMDTIMARLAQAHPDTDAKTVVSVTPLNERVVGNVRPMLVLLAASVGFVLLIACLNVASLMLARAAARRREIAIRLAIGAQRFHIARIAVAEGTLLATVGGAIGLALAALLVHSIAGVLPKGAMPRQNELGLDYVAVAFTAFLSLVSGALSALIPAWQSSRADVNETLKEAGRSGTASRTALRTRGILIAGEIALAFLLLTGSGLLLHSFARLLSLDPGFVPAHLLTLQVSVAGTAKQPAPYREQFYRQVLDQVAAVPGVKSVSAINHIPISGDVWGISFRIDGQPMPPPGEFPNAAYRVVEPGYFATMQTPIFSGRDFSVRDNLNASPVVIVNQTTARKYWPNGDAVGRRIIRGETPVTVVGIVHDVKQADWQATPTEELYFPFLQSRDFLDEMGNHVSAMGFVVRTATDPALLATTVENTIHALDRTVLVSNITTMEQAIAKGIWRQRLSLMLLGIFSLVALALAITGIYGVVSHAVTQRTHEFGIRMALGAGRFNIQTLAIKQGMAPVWIGSAIGLALSIPGARLMQAMLFEVRPADPWTLVGVAATLTLAGLLANYLPARRASNTGLSLCRFLSL